MTTEQRYEIHNANTGEVIPPGGKDAGTAIRRSVSTSTVDVLTIAGQASAAEVAIPEGFKQKS